MPSEIEKFKLRLAREKLARQQAENLLEEKAAALYEKNQQLISLTDDLEKQVANRTAQMQKARDEALQALKIKSDFIANMSHELRTPMNGVLGVLSILSHENLNEEQRELLETAQSSGEHLLMVINDVLDFSKIEADKVELVMAPLNIRSYLDNLCKSFQLQAKQKNLEFSLNIDSAIPNELVTDKLRLTQILTNLLSNALKFTLQGQVSVSFESKEVRETDGDFRLIVSDTGIGISPQNLNSVFAAFEQADTSITREFGGTGLGMSITKKLVDMFDGKITVSSELNSGTCFFVDITMQISGEHQVVECAKSVDKNLASTTRILLVEDNKINQLVAKKMLSNWGLQIEIEEDGQQAIDRLKKDTFDIILMDLQMPVKGGVTATKEIRSKGLISSKTPIIAMTAHSTQEHIDECFDAGMQGHISKPIEIDKLQGILKQFVGDLDISNDETLVNRDIIIHGINIQDGLKRLHGDWTLYYSLIKNFLTEHENLGDTLNVLVKSKQADQTRELLHRIKGSGSNLGMTDLAKSAAKLEDNIRGGAQIFPTQIEIESLQRFIEEITSSFALIENPNNSKSSADNRNESIEYISDQMDSILDNLSKDVLASEEGLKDLMQCNMSEDTMKFVNEANNAMLQFDIETVANAIKKAQKTVV